jgi:hypothetical protein
LFDDTCHYPAAVPTNNDKPAVLAESPAPGVEPQSRQQQHVQPVEFWTGETEPLTVRRRAVAIAATSRSAGPAGNSAGAGSLQ